MVLIARTGALAFSRPTILSSSLHRGLRPVITSTTKDATDSIEFLAFFSLSRPLILLEDFFVLWEIMFFSFFLFEKCFYIAFTDNTFVMN